MQFRCVRFALFTMLFACFSSRELYAQFTRPGSGVAVFLVTAGPGSDFLSWFGHAALVVSDARRKQDYWYDYGIVDSVLNSTTDELRGHLRARVIKHLRPRDFIANMLADDRDVVVQQLLLPAASIDSMVRQLDADVFLLGRTGYAYSHTNDNCTTRIRDIINRYSGGALWGNAHSNDAALTIRQVGHQQFSMRNAFIEFAMGFVAGRPVDVPMTRWDDEFMPHMLELEVGNAQLANGQRLAIQRFHSVTQHHQVPATPPDEHLEMLASGTLIALLALLLAYAGRANSPYIRRRAAVALGVCSAVVSGVLGTVGLLIVGSWTFTQYAVARDNENLWFCNPLVLVLVPVSIAYTLGAPRAARQLQLSFVILVVCVSCALLMKALSFSSQDNWSEIAFTLPLYMGFALAFSLQARKAS
jgi:hypothetical protein